MLGWILLNREPIDTPDLRVFQMFTSISIQLNFL